jgi:hypothetical protein
LGPGIPSQYLIIWSPTPTENGTGRIQIKIEKQAPHRPHPNLHSTLDRGCTVLIPFPTGSWPRSRATHAGTISDGAWTRRSQIACPAVRRDVAVEARIMHPIRTRTHAAEPPPQQLRAGGRAGSSAGEGDAVVARSPSKTDQGSCSATLQGVDRQLAWLWLLPRIPVCSS